MADISRLRFFWRAIWADIKQSGRWKIIAASYTLIGIIRLALWPITKWSPAELIELWSRTATVIFILAFVCLGLVLSLIAVVDGARRLYIEAVKELDDQLADAKADFKSRSSRLKELCEVYGRAYQVRSQFSSEVERPATEALRHLAERLGKALWACYGSAGTEKFTEGRDYYSVTVPEDESKHSEWVYNTHLRLGDLIEEESPKPVPAHIPDAAFRS